MAPLGAFAIGIEWQRPLGFVALALPLLVYLLHRLRAAESLATGTLAIWRTVADEDRARAARSRRALAPSVWLLLAALCAGALALAGPRREEAPRGRTFHVALDRSPSMYIPWRADEAEAEEGTRLERALAQLAPLLEELAGESDVIVWLAPDASGLARHEGRMPPPEWLAPPPLPLPAPEWARYDAPGTFWVSDRAPDPRPHAAGLSASGGAAVPGPVGRVPEGRLDWDGRELVALPGALPPAILAVRGGVEQLPEELASLAALWAQDRGLELGTEADGVVELELGVASTGERREVAAGRDGWSLAGRAASAGAPRMDALGPLSVWLADGELPLVTAGPGRAELALTELERIDGDPAAFLVSWARFLDALRLAPPGSVPVAERLAAGPAVLHAPSALPPRDARRGAPVALDAWLALLALLLALSALFVARRRAPRSGRPPRRTTASPGA